MQNVGSGSSTDCCRISRGCDSITMVSDHQTNLILYKQILDMQIPCQCYTDHIHFRTLEIVKNYLMSGYRNRQ